jgi:hypothetical protein
MLFLQESPLCHWHHLLFCSSSHSAHSLYAVSAFLPCSLLPRPSQEPRSLLLQPGRRESAPKPFSHHEVDGIPTGISPKPSTEATPTTGVPAQEVALPFRGCVSQSLPMPLLRSASRRGRTTPRTRTISERMTCVGLARSSCAARKSSPSPFRRSLRPSTVYIALQLADFGMFDGLFLLVPSPTPRPPYLNLICWVNDSASVLGQCWVKESGEVDCGALAVPDLFLGINHVRRS